MAELAGPGGQGGSLRLRRRARPEVDSGLCCSEETSVVRTQAVSFFTFLNHSWRCSGLVSGSPLRDHSWGSGDPKGCVR